MKNIFLFLLRKYIASEKGRLFVFNSLHHSVSNEYPEQTPFGNVYNANIEFLMSNNLVKKLVTEGDKKGLEIVKSGLNESFDDVVILLAQNNHK